MNLAKLRKIIDTQVSERDYISQELQRLKKQKKKLKRVIMRKEKALLFVEDVAVQTQTELSGGLQEYVSAGLNSVFDIPYGFKADFRINRGRPECNMFFEKRGKLIDPLTFSGLGAADVAAFAARVSCLTIAKRFRKVLLLDEPFQRLKGRLANQRVIDLMQTLSHKFGIQIICVNDERADRDDIVAGADRVFLIDQINQKSMIKVL